MKVSASSSARHPTPKVAEAAGPDPSVQTESTDNVSDVLDADKIAKTDADLEKLGINTLKGRRPLRPPCRPRSLGVQVNPLSSSLMSPQ